MKSGGSIGTGPRDGKHKGPLRNIVRVVRHARNMFDTDWVVMQCGHEGVSYGGVRARCRACGERAR